MTMKDIKGKVNLSLMPEGFVSTYYLDLGESRYSDLVIDILVMLDKDNFFRFDAVEHIHNLENRSHLDMLEEIAKVREYGTAKYKGDSEGWKKVPVQHFKDACARHLRKVLKNQNFFDRDEESGLLHISHAACNLMFIYELMKNGKQHSEKTNKKK